MEGDQVCDVAWPSVTESSYPVVTVGGARLAVKGNLVKVCFHGRSKLFRQKKSQSLAELQTEIDEWAIGPQYCKQALSHGLLDRITCITHLLVRRNRWEPNIAIFAG